MASAGASCRSMGHLLLYLLSVVLCSLMPVFDSVSPRRLAGSNFGEILCEESPTVNNSLLTLETAQYLLHLGSSPDEPNLIP
jgi:hypothetical protein